MTPPPLQHAYAFDPTYGSSLADLHAMRSPEAPPGYDAFWGDRYQRALTIHSQPRLRESAFRLPDSRVEDLVYSSTDGFEIGGWLMRPQTGRVRRGLVVGHGYGGREQPDINVSITETALRSKRPFAHIQTRWKSASPQASPSRTGHGPQHCSL